MRRFDLHGRQWLRRGLLAIISALVVGLSGSYSWPTIAVPAPESSIAQAPALSPEQLVQAGRQRYAAGEYRAAIDLWEQARSTLAAQSVVTDQALVLSYLALAYQQLGQWPEANQRITTSVQLLQGRADQAGPLAEVLNTWGSLQQAQGQSEAALSTWQQATLLYQQENNQDGLVRTLINQAQALRSLGLYPRMRETLEQVNQVVQTQSPSRLKVAALLSYGEALRLANDLSAARVVLEQSLAMAETLKLPAEMAAALISLGNTARANQLPQKAIEYYQRAAAVGSDQKLKTLASLNQFRLLVEREEWPAAAALMAPIQSGLANLPPDRITIHAQVNFAQSLMKWQGPGPTQLPQAAQILAMARKQALALGDARAESYALGYLGSVYEQNRQWQEAQSLTEQALLLAQASNAPDIAYRWQWQLGRLLKVQADATRPPNQGPDYAKAIVAYQEAIHSLNLIRNDLVTTNPDLQFSFRESVEPVYRQLVSLLLANQDQVNQQTLEQARDVLESLQIAELDNFFQEACLVGRSQKIDRVDPNAAVLYPIILPDRLEVVLSLPNGRLTHYPGAIAQADLERLIEQMRQSLRRTSTSKNRNALAQQLYNLLIQPLQAELAANQIKTLAFVLDGALKNLPMAALYDGQQYLVEKYSIALTPSLQLLAPQALTRQQLQLLIAGLSEARQGFPPLPGVETEVKQIASEAQSAVLLNQQFTATALSEKIKSTSSPVVHLATHGQFSSNAQETFILAWDHPITVKQLGDLLQSRSQGTLNPIELLVLSACQTAAGDKRAALGLAGVAVRSGARSTLATLWPVDDQSTSAFMVRFYQELAQSGVNRAEAVRQAQLSLLQQAEFRHPYYWAPFVLVGNWL